MENILNILLTVFAEGGEQNPFSTFIFLILIVVVFYFFMIRPQVKKQKEVRKFREGLKKGDKVVTVGGIYGKITDLDETTVSLDVGNNVRLKVDKNGLIKDPTELAQK
ncbi:MAG: preprotein translocase subunit YajC [Bacteroidia bacterium]|nr:MAG: preprotein translocase subunit YajC [Bacteroidia bacterium]